MVINISQQQNGNQHQSATKWQSTSVSNKMVLTTLLLTDVDYHFVAD
jgi:hypothetical protein